LRCRVNLGESALPHPGMFLSFRNAAVDVVLEDGLVLGAVNAVKPHDVLRERALPIRSASSRAVCRRRSCAGEPISRQAAASLQRRME
jgi:hypothetical protein